MIYQLTKSFLEVLSASPLWPRIKHHQKRLRYIIWDSLSTARQSFRKCQAAVGICFNHEWGSSLVGGRCSCPFSLFGRGPLQHLFCVVLEIAKTVTVLSGCHTTTVRNLGPLPLKAALYSKQPAHNHSQHEHTRFYCLLFTVVPRMIPDTRYVLRKSNACPF